MVLDVPAALLAHPVHGENKPVPLTFSGSLLGLQLGKPGHGAVAPLAAQRPLSHCVGVASGLVGHMLG